MKELSIEEIKVNRVRAYFGESDYTKKEIKDKIKILDFIEDSKRQINEKLNYLKDTDWVVVKINEAKMQDEDVSSLLEKYSEVLSNRKQVREDINNFEAQINETKGD